MNVQAEEKKVITDGYILQGQCTCTNFEIVIRPAVHVVCLSVCVSDSVSLSVYDGEQVSLMLLLQANKNTNNK